jgi:uncharacterized protein
VTAPRPGKDEIPLPRLEPDNRPFWTSGARGALEIMRCASCGWYAHPPVPRCRRCDHDVLVPTPVTGKGSIFSYTVNHQQFIPALEPPYVVAIVELEEQEGLQFMTRVVSCDPAEVRIGMPVRVVFEEHGEIFLPHVSPLAEAADGE